MATPQDKMVKAIIDGLSDSRTQYSVAMNQVLDEADRNDNLHAPLWGMIVTYLYNRATRHAIKITHTPNQEHVAEKSYEMVTNVLEPDYSQWSGGLQVSGRSFDPPDIPAHNINL